MSTTRGKLIDYLVKNQELEMLGYLMKELNALKEYREEMDNMKAILKDVETPFESANGDEGEENRFIDINDLEDLALDYKKMKGVV
jgi:hypothetical protein